MPVFIELATYTAWNIAVHREHQQQMRWARKATLLNATSFLSAVDTSALACTNRQMEELIEQLQANADQADIIQNTLGAFPVSPSLQILGRKVCTIARQGKRLAKVVKKQMIDAHEWTGLKQMAEELDLESAQIEDIRVGRQSFKRSVCSMQSMKSMHMDDWDNSLEDAADATRRSDASDASDGSSSWSLFKVLKGMKAELDDEAAKLEDPCEDMNRIRTKRKRAESDQLDAPAPQLWNSDSFSSFSELDEPPSSPISTTSIVPSWTFGVMEMYHLIGELEKDAQEAQHTAPPVKA